MIIDIKQEKSCLSLLSSVWLRYIDITKAPTHSTISTIFFERKLKRFKLKKIKEKWVLWLPKNPSLHLKFENHYDIIAKKFERKLKLRKLLGDTDDKV